MYDNRQDSETSCETYKSVSIWLMLQVNVNVYKHPMLNGKSINTKKYNQVI